MEDLTRTVGKLNSVSRKAKEEETPHSRMDKLNSGPRKAENGAKVDQLNSGSRKAEEACI